MIPILQRLRLGSPAASGLPAWLSGKAVLEWVDIPNSNFISTIDINDDLEWITNDLGYETLPSAGNGYVCTFGVNKYGQKRDSMNSIAWLSKHRYSFSGMGFDSRGSKILIGGGDAHYGPNEYNRLTFGTDSPYWERRIVASSPVSEWRQANSAVEEATAQGDDDTAFGRMYDGGHRGGHSYFFQTFLEGREWMIHHGAQQFWPYDSGSSAKTNVADVAAGQWLTTYPIGDVLGWGNDEDAWQQKHPVTEDLYYWGVNGRLYVLRESTLADEVVLAMPEYSGARVSGSINWEEDYVLVVGRIGAGGSPRGVAFMTSLSSPAKQVVTFAGDYVSDFVPYRNGGLSWCPDIGKHLWVGGNTGDVYSLEKTGATEFTVDLVSMTGTPPTAAALSAKGGGVLNNFQYVPELKGMVWRLDDKYEMKFFRTG